MTMRTVRIAVPKRDGYEGWYAAGRLWPSGVTTETVTEEVYQKLLLRPEIAVVEVPGEAVAEENKKPAEPVVVTETPVQTKPTFDKKK